MSAPDATVPVVGQLAAYNARDIDAFVPWFAEDVEVFRLGEATPMLAGRDALRARYGPMFAAHPDLHCELVSRAVVRQTVVDQEAVRGLGDDIVEALAIYEVEDGLIRRVWFAR